MGLRLARPVRRGCVRDELPQPLLLTGRAFLRWDWLFYFVGSVCLVKKEKPLLGGMFLGYAALLRVFPAFCLIGPALVVGQQLLGEPSPERPWWKPKPFANVRELVARIDRRYLRFFAGLAIVFVTLVPISLVMSNGVASHVDFYKNSQKHNKTPLTNYMGLKTVLIYRPSEVVHLEFGEVRACCPGYPVVGDSSFFIPADPTMPIYGAGHLNPDAVMIVVDGGPDGATEAGTDATDDAPGDATQDATDDGAADAGAD